MHFFVFILTITLWGVSGGILPSIPEHLLPCYRSDGANSSAPQRLDVLNGILHTLETNTQLNLRMFTTGVLRNLRLDGIVRGSNAIESEFVTPYHASGFQFHKYQLLMDVFLPSQDLQLLTDIENTLPVSEICLLHKMLSSTINAMERGDERVVCPDVLTQTSAPSTNISGVNSRCPIEGGVIQTDWGTIAPGTIVAALAASLESQRVLVTDVLSNNLFRSTLTEPLQGGTNVEELNIETLDSIDAIKGIPRMADADISNVFVATIAGDLAEVAVHQGPRVGMRQQKLVLGGPSRWNDTLLPRNYYLLNYTNNGSYTWQFTDSEILAGIDGLILGHHLPSWIQQRETIRLSQILDMYYSNEGITFDPTIKACNRQIMFEKLLDVPDLITDVSNFAHVLNLKKGSVYIPVAEMDKICNLVVMAFLDYYPKLLSRHDSKCGISENIPAMDMIVTTDGSWRGYDMEQFASWLGKEGYISTGESTLGLLNGQTANWIAPPSRNLTTLYDHVQNYTGNWPNRLDFPVVLSSLMRHFENKTLEQAIRQVSVTPSTVVVVVCPSDRLSEVQIDRARDVMAALRTTYFDIYFYYVAQDLGGFKNVNTMNYDYSEMFSQLSSTSMEDIILLVKEEIITKEVPKSIIGAQCSFNGTTFTQVPYEDFIEPNKSNEYRIHPYYLKLQPRVAVQIRNKGQGSLQICSWRGAEKPSNCHRIEDRNILFINFTNPCDSEEFCPPAHIKVTGLSSTNNCANKDCRFPHSINYDVQHIGLRCLNLRNFVTTQRPFMIYVIILILTVLFIL